MRSWWAVVAGATLAPVALAAAPVANAGLMAGNYSAIVDGRYDFHTWTWGVSACQWPDAVGQCARISANPMPIGRADAWYGKAYLNNDTYTLTVDVPDGLRCGNIYYGPIIATHDVYTFNVVTLAGKLDSSSDVGCDGAPGGTITYPFRLVRL